ncbi:MAG: hypothetical protein CVU64_04065 [Deltaproteobacteria bacterium HGW-Deltaproteobacteria-21]|nr:MAG: hypothetical protein CVU64_04065 [Deltaproteobacteria bacterium HGW-Deltaproteobacteria-21]
MNGSAGVDPRKLIREYEQRVPRKKGEVMRVQQSQIQMASQVLSAERYELQESLRFWVGDGDPSTNEAAQESPFFQIEDKVTLSSPCRSEETLQCEKEELAGKDVRNEIIRLLLERLTGRKIKILDSSDFEPVHSQGEQKQQEHSPAANDSASAGFGLAYDRYEHYSETQSLQFVSRGVLLTEEGREIRFELQLEMERSFSTTEYTSIRLGDARKMDPLVVNLNGRSAILTDATFSFDINSDGVEEQMASLGPGKGFLAIDKNGDGRITDGSELFGPSLGDGFLELAGLDKDGNGWVDENDPGFKDLGVWSKDPEGNEQMVQLQDVGIGAVYTGRIATPFALKNAENELRGEVKETGIYIKEDGSAGAVQELNLVI